MTEATPRFMSAPQAAQRLGVHASTIHNWIGAGVLVDRKVPGSTTHRFLAAEIEEIAADRLLAVQSRLSGLVPYAQLADVLDSLGVLCRENRRRLNMSLRDAAALAHVPHNSLARVEKGDDFKIGTAVRLIRWLDA